MGGTHIAEEFSGILTLLDSVHGLRQRATVAMVVLAALILAAGATGQRRGLFSPVEPTVGRSVSAISPNGPIVRQRLVAIDFDMLAALRAVADRQDVPPATVRVNLFDDVEFTAIVESTQPTSSGYSLFGRTLELDLATIVLVVNGEVVAGTVRTPEATYRIRTAEKGVFSISQADPAEADKEDEPVIVPAPVPEALRVPR